MDAKRKALWMFIVGGLLVTFALAFFVSPYASGSPDGLNKVAEDQGFDASAVQHSLDDSPVAGYEVKGVEDEELSKGLSGLIGVTLTFGIGMIVFGLLVRRNRGDTSSNDTSGGNAATTPAGVT